MSRLRTRLLPVGILLGAVVIAVVMVQLRPEPPLREPPSRLPFVTTAAAEALQGSIPVFGAGTVRPRAEIDVAAEVSGKVAWVAPAFQSGGRVGAGDVLFRIDDADYQNRVQQARANVAAQQVALLQAEEEARIARAEYEGFQRRRSDGTASGQASPLTLREPQLQAARAALARDSASLADAELALSRTEVTAPFSGIVRMETVDPGQFVGPGQSVGRLYADDAVEVVVPLSDQDAALISGLWELAAGDGNRRVTAAVSAEYGDMVYSWSGYVDRAETALDEQTRTIDVVVRIPRPMAGGTPADDDITGDGDASSMREAPPLLVGQFVEVQIDGASPERYFAIPRAALRTGNEVWALRGGNLLTIVPVRVLQRADEVVYATGGLEDGQQVVVSGIQIATEGMAVRTGVE
ncbi:MAG: efflux RND transporter periplasmic adaptor subunit [Gemmatimonadota bacterium]|nr:efflux RND transporter periplasmic adaptor subunit [Gemmatimonadota bacterium]MDE2865766.1 efflux RND transporter periplasmic adaptor subunit [Gemmatimonadota bacterium]MYB06951.1 efflux RND transporter periplasmic adaptor subunit [Gemmatimonadota bacterium]MYG21410.1 efflux RND transporter periplasmic adaptor subunit [Gemmatimonadota bacterium]MYJ38000.1 efflux RND transporter periplasmic adaptor subunit [Gemmatimonadota bacterium]